MKKLTVLALAVILCCMTACKKKDSDFSSPTKIINLFDEIIGLSVEDAQQIVEKQGFKLEDSEQDIDRDIYWYDKNGYMFQFSANKEDIVYMAAYGALGTSSRLEAEKAVSAWLKQLGETYTTRLGHKCKFTYVGNESSESFDYDDWERIWNATTEGFTAYYANGVVMCRIVAGGEEDEFDTYYITIADASWVMIGNMPLYRKN